MKRKPLPKTGVVPRKEGKKDTQRTPSRARALAPVLREIAENGLSLRQACRKLGKPAWQTVLRWADADPKLGEQYARACEAREQMLHDELLELADDGRFDKKTVTVKGGLEVEVIDQEVLGRSRLQIDTRKWILARMNPRKYGDKVETTIQGGDKPVTMAIGPALDFEKIRAKREKVGAT